MAEIPETFLVHRAVVETLTGRGAYGDIYAAPVEIKCFIDSRRRLVRSLDGSEVISEATFLARLEHAERCSPESRIALHTETPGLIRKTKIISAAPRSDGSMGAWQHLEVVTG